MIKPGKQNKFRNKPKKYNGRTYHSTLEADYAAELDLKIKAGIVKNWEPQHRFYLKINGHKWCTYTIDFRVVNADGTVSYVEIKGRPTPDWILKFEATKILFDELTEGEHARLYLNSELVLTSTLF